MDRSGVGKPRRSAADRNGGFSRRSFLTGVVGLGAVAGLADVPDGPLWWREDAFAATAPLGPPTTTVPLPTTTVPEQLLLTWGADPATAVTVSWSSPGTVAQPAPKLAYSTSPITAANPGRVVSLPEPQPLDVTQGYPRAASVSTTTLPAKPFETLVFGRGVPRHPGPGRRSGSKVLGASPAR